MAHGVDLAMAMSGLCLLQALSMLRSVNVGTQVQLTVNKCSPSAADNVSDSEGSATPVNRSNDSVNIVAASVPGTQHSCDYYD